MITSGFVPKEKQSAYQRWEMDSLETPEEPEIPQEAEIENSIPEEQPAPVVLPTEEEVAAIFQQAKEAGYAAGYQEGHAAGYKEGRETAEVEVKAEVARLQTILSALDQDLREMDQHVANELLELAIALARKVVTQSLELKPDLIIPAVQEAIRNLPSAMQHPRIYLHPDDAKLVTIHLRDQIEQDHWSIREDERISRGGCRIEANGSEINGSLEVRWQRTLSAIGQTGDWLEEKERHGTS